MSVKVQFEIGHTAAIKSKKSFDIFTHDWELYVKGVAENNKRENADISAFVEKVVFNLHDSFPKPKRTVKEPPYILKESGYAGFILPIDIHFKNRHVQTFNYDLELQTVGPPIHKMDIKQYVFENPSEDFRQKLLKGGGVYIGNNDDKNRDSSDEYKQLLNKPKFSNELSKKHKVRPDKNKEPTFANLFGTPIQKSSPIPTNSGILVSGTGSNSNSSSSKVSPDPKSKSSPIINSTSGISSTSLTKSNTNNKTEKGYSSGQSMQLISNASGVSGVNNKDKYDKGDKKEKLNKHNSPHKEKSAGSKDSKKDDKHDRRDDRKKDKSHSKERDRSREKILKRPSSPQSKQRPASPLPRKLSPIRNSSKLDSHSSSKSKGNHVSNSGDLDRKLESKKAKKDKKSHEKEKGREKVREKDRFNNDQSKIKDLNYQKSSSNRIENLNQMMANTDANKLDYSNNKSKDITSSLQKSVAKKTENKFSDSYSDKKINENLEKDEKRHKHKKKDKSKEKEKSSTKLNKDDNKRIKETESSSKSQKYSTQSTTNSTIPNAHPDLSDSDSNMNSDSEIQQDSTSKQKQLSTHSDSSSNSYKDIPASRQNKQPPQSQLISSTSLTGALTPDNSNSSTSTINKKERKNRESKKLEKEDKKRKRKSRDDIDTIVAKKPNSPIATSSNSSESIPKYSKKNDMKNGSSVQQDSGSYPTTPQDSFRTPSSTTPTNAITSSTNANNTNNAFQNNRNNNNNNNGCNSIDYMSELRELQKKIMTLQDNTELQQVVEMIAATGRYEVTSKTFDFDLCALDRNTVQRLQDFFAATSVS